jgi:transcriptional regulator with XRE-family HTH domain
LLKGEKVDMNWTEINIDNFLSRITFDFITQLEKRMESLPMTQAQLAEKLNLSESRVSQILNGSHNLELKSIIKYARALGMKVAVVAYNDNDPNNNNGLINSEIFNTCWEKLDKPSDFFAVEESFSNTQLEKFENKKIESSVTTSEDTISKIGEVKKALPKLKLVKPRQSTTPQITFDWHGTHLKAVEDANNTTIAKTNKFKDGANNKVKKNTIAVQNEENADTMPLKYSVAGGTW